MYTRCTVPFLACGDLSGWDADRSYELHLPDSQQQQQQQAGTATATAGSYVVLEPVQKPVHAAYKTALELQRSQGRSS